MIPLYIIMSLVILILVAAGLVPFYWLFGAMGRLEPVDAVCTGYIKKAPVHNEIRSPRYPTFQFRLASGLLSGCTYRFNNERYKDGQVYHGYVDSANPSKLFLPGDYIQWLWLFLFLAPAGILVFVTFIF